MPQAQIAVLVMGREAFNVEGAYLSSDEIVSMIEEIDGCFKPQVLHLQDFLTIDERMTMVHTTMEKIAAGQDVFVLHDTSTALASTVRLREVFFRSHHNRKCIFITSSRLLPRQLLRTAKNLGFALGALRHLLPGIHLTHEARAPYSRDTLRFHVTYNEQTDSICWNRPGIEES